MQTQCEFRTAQVWREFCRIYPQLQKFKMPQIKLNGRFTKTAANCEVEHNIINIGTKFLIQHNQRIMQEIIPHEIAHQVDFNLNGLPKGNRWHGANWQVIMQDYGLEPKPYHNMEVQ